ncbi:MAG: type IV pilin protein [Methylococcales bacterium]
MKTIRRDSEKGFSLIELMIAIVIIGILAGIGYPSYQSHMRASRRAEAQSDLLQLASFMERFFSINYRYDQDTAGVGTVLPFDESPQFSSNPAYIITPTFAATSYRLKATPAVNSPQAGDGYLELRDAGGRIWDTNNNNTVESDENDWER